MEHKYTGPERRVESEGWHFDKRIPIATLVTLVVLTITATMYISAIRADVELLRQQNKMIIDRMNRSDALTASQVQETKNSVLRLESKIDRLLERISTNGGRP